MRLLERRWSTTSERDLIGLARGGSGAAIGEIMRHNNRRLFRAARGIIGTDWEAEEIVQDAYVKAFGALGASAKRPPSAPG